jgi:hypothetical protein
MVGYDAAAELRAPRVEGRKSFRKPLVMDSATASSFVASFEETNVISLSRRGALRAVDWISDWGILTAVGYRVVTYGTRAGITKVEIATNLYIEISQIWRLNVSSTRIKHIPYLFVLLSFLYFSGDVSNFECRQTLAVSNVTLDEMGDLTKHRAVLICMFGIRSATLCCR